jgi:hypothetical protein
MQPYHQPQPLVTEAELMEQQRERAAYQREVVRFLLLEKERRRQALKKSRRGSVPPLGNAESSSTGKKSPRSKMISMTPIAEAE